MQLPSVPARLVNAGVQVVAGDAHSITYKVESHAVTAELVLAERVPSPAAVLRHVRRNPGHRVFVGCETVSDEARSPLLADTGVDRSVGSIGELVLSGRTCRAPAAHEHPVRPANAAGAGAPPNGSVCSRATTCANATSQRPSQ